VQNTVAGLERTGNAALAQPPSTAGASILRERFPP
jgi:hypothetical protein